jgi:ketopantoate reductase
MERLDNYRQYIKKILEDYAQLSVADTEVDTELIFDESRGHYQLLHVGWQRQHRVYGCVLHFDLKNGKIWIQHNGTEANIAAELEDFGVPKQDIVLGFRSPVVRPHTGYAVT